ncbi:MAG: hypothetical protein NVSMB66_6410 [Candidatus Doudnabacteria bacterium]
MKKLLILPTLLFGIMLAGAGCSSDVSSSSGNIEQNHTEANQQALLQQQPPVTLTWSLERDNINKRTNLWNNPNKVSYIYLVNFGKVMAFYTIKGKVSSVNSQVTNSSQLTWKCVNADGTYASSGNCNDFGQKIVEGVIPSPSEDGSYGTNGNSVFFFTTDGAYVEWQGDYMLADQPLKLTTQPELVREIK